MKPWQVDFDLAYDGGGSSWVKAYRTKLGAKLSIFWNKHIASWGGTARLKRISQDPIPLWKKL